MALVDEQDVRVVVRHKVPRSSRSISDLDATAEPILQENGTELHIISERFHLGRRGRPVRDGDGPTPRCVAEVEAEIAGKRSREGIDGRQHNPEYYHGPEGPGFEKDDDGRVPSETPNRVQLLEMLQTGKLSKRAGPQELDTSRRTIIRAPDRADLYGFEE